LLTPFDIFNPATPPAGQCREDTLPFSRRVKLARERAQAWHDSIERACDQVFVDICLLATFALGFTLIGIVVLEAIGLDVVSHLPGRAL
jgi:hypothetical protein